MKNLILFILSLILIPNILSAQCQIVTIDGFESLGEFQGSKYFIAENAANWETAQSIAESHMGYLASISSAEENEYLRSQIDEILFIGFSDVQSEDDFQWTNNEPVVFNNLSDTNTDDKDYGKINFWNGGWGLDNQYVARRYIMEIPCGESDCSSGEILVVACDDNNACTINDQQTILALDESICVPCQGTLISCSDLENTSIVSCDDLNPNTINDVQTILDCDGTICIPCQGTTISNAECPEDITGFTNIGEFQNSKYYISNTNSRPTDAQAIAEINGGYLVVINTQEENDFVQAGANELTYIGLNDIDSEGNLTWINGESLTYSNIAPCNFCNENSEEQDFVVIAPWDGAWSFSNFYNQRKFIMEIPCGEGSGESQLPDLTISSLTSINQNGNDYSFDLEISNQSDYSVLGEFLVETYVSNTANIDNNSILVNQQNINDFSDGEIQLSIDFSEMLLPNETYFLLVRLDGQQQISELSENNNESNIMFNTIDLEASSSCSYFKKYLSGSDNLIRSYSFEEDLDGLRLEMVSRFTDFNTNTYQYIHETFNIDSVGDVIDSTNVILSTPEKPKFANLTHSISFPDNSPNNGTFQILQTGNNQETNWVKNIDLLSSETDYVFNIKIEEFDDHLLVHGIVQMVFSQANYNYFFIKLDLNGNIIWSELHPVEVPLENNIEFQELCNGNEYIFKSGVNSQIVLFKINSTGQMIWTKSLDITYGKDRITYGGLYNNEAIYVSKHNELFYGSKITKIDAQTGQTIWEKLIIDIIPNIEGGPEKGKSIDGLLITNDGGVVFKADFERVSFPDKIYYKIVRVDKNGNLVWSHELPENIRFQFAKFATKDGGFLLSGTINNSINVYKINSDGSFDPSCDENGEEEIECNSSLSGFEYLGELNGSSYFLSESTSRPMAAQSIAEANGGYLASINSQAENDFLYPLIDGVVYIGMHDFDSEASLAWTNGDPVNFTNFDICNFCNANTEEMDFTMMHSWNGGWSWSNQFNQRKYIVEIPCDSENNNMESSSCSLVKSFPVTGGNSSRVISVVENDEGLLVSHTYGSYSRKSFQLDNDNEIVAIDSLYFQYGRGSRLGDYEYVFDIYPNNFLLATVNQQGDRLWLQDIDVTNSSSPPSSYTIKIFQEVDDHILIGGIRSLFNQGGYQPFLIKLDILGNFIWSKDFEIYENFPQLKFIDESQSGGYYLEMNFLSERTKFVIRTDEFGNQLWLEEFFNPNFEPSIIYGGESSDGSGFYLSVRDSDSPFFGISKLNSSTGDLLWNNEIINDFTIDYENDFFNHSIVRILSTIDGGVVLVVYLNSSNGTVTRYGKLTAEGTTLWSYELPQGLISFKPVFSLSDGGYIFGNEKESESSFGLFKIDPEGIIIPWCLEDLQPDLTLDRIKDTGFGYEIGGEIPISFEIHNNDLGIAEGEFLVGVYFRPYPNFSSNASEEFFVTSFSFNNLPFGIHNINNDLLTPVLNIPVPDIPLGLYEIYLKVDSENDIMESNEENNVFFADRIRVLSPIICEESIDGFDYLGRFGNSVYFVSEDTALPNDAQDVALSVGGHLVAINSFNENIFLYQNFDGIAYIGLNDVEVEGQLSWVNGDGINYTIFELCDNFSDCNNQDYDYVLFNESGTGIWSWVDGNIPYKYIIEVPCQIDSSYNNYFTSNTENSITIESQDELKDIKNFGNHLTLQKVYPNPAMDYIFTMIHSPEEQDVNLQIFNANGSLIRSFPINIIKGENTNRIPIADLPSGIYTIYLPQLKGRNIAKRFVKIKH